MLVCDCMPIGQEVGQCSTTMTLGHPLVGLDTSSKTAPPLPVVSASSYKQAAWLPGAGVSAGLCGSNCLIDALHVYLQRVSRVAAHILRSHLPRCSSPFEDNSSMFHRATCILGPLIYSSCILKGIPILLQEDSQPSACCLIFTIPTLPQSTFIQIHRAPCIAEMADCFFDPTLCPCWTARVPLLRRAQCTCTTVAKSRIVLKSQLGMKALYSPP